MCVLHCAHGLGWCWVTSPHRSVQGGFIVQPRHRRMEHGGRDEHGRKCVRPLRISPLQRRRERSMTMMQHDSSLPPHMRTHCALKLVLSLVSHTALASYGLDGKRDHGACVGLTSCVVCGACACGCRSVVCSCVVLCTWLGWCWVTFPRRSVPRSFIVQPRHRRMGHGGRDVHGIQCVRPLHISPLQR